MNIKSLLIKIFFSLALFVAVAMQVDYTQLKPMAENIHPLSWLYAIGLILLQIVALALRWKLLVNAGTIKHIGFMTSLRITAVSFLANYLFITSLGGIITRIVLTMSHGFPFVKSLAATIVDRGMTLFALILLASACIPFIGNFFALSLSNIIMFSALLFIAAIAGLFLLYKFRRILIFANRKITVSVKYLRSLLTDPMRIFQIAFLSLISQLLYFASVYAVVHSLSIDFSFMKFMAIMPVITIISSLPVGYGGWGIREGAFIYGLGLIHLPAEAAFVASVQIGIISMFSAVISGIPAFISTETQNSLAEWKRHRRERRSHAHS